MGEILFGKILTNFVIQKEVSIAFKE